MVTDFFRLLELLTFVDDNMDDDDDGVDGGAEVDASVVDDDDDVAGCNSGIVIDFFDFLVMTPLSPEETLPRTL